MDSTRTPVRLVVWATGAVGRAALHEIIGDPRYELVGVRVYSADKVGIDAADLCGRSDPTGVRATDSTDAIVDLGADVILHAASKAHPHDSNLDDICRLLSSGSDVITTTSYAHLETCGPQTRSAILEACAAGHSRFHAAGENPGFMFERLVATATGLVSTVDRIELFEATDVSGVSSLPMLTDLMGMGRPPEEVEADAPVLATLDLAYRQALAATADVFRVDLDEITLSVENTTIDRDLTVSAGVIRAGTVVGRRFSWTASRGGSPLLAIHEEWVLTRDLPQWGLRPLAVGEKAPLIRAVIHGVPSIELQLDVGYDDVPPGLAGTLPGHLMIAMTAVRAIDDVRASEPGVVVAPVFGAIKL